MRSLILACLFAAATAPALACPAIQGQDVNDEYVQAFIKAARKIGMPCPAFFSDDGTAALVQYLPEGETREDWKSMMAANIIYLGDAKPGQEIAALGDKFIARIKDKDGETEQLLEAPSAFGTMRLIRYNMRENGHDEKALVMIRPVGPDKAALLHWHKREGDFSEDDIKLFGAINGVGGKIEKFDVPPDAEETDKLVFEIEGIPPEADTAKPRAKKPVIKAAPAKEVPVKEPPVKEPDIKEPPAKEMPPVKEPPAETPKEPPKEPMVKEEPADAPPANRTAPKDLIQSTI